MIAKVHLLVGLQAFVGEAVDERNAFDDVHHGGDRGLGGDEGRERRSELQEDASNQKHVRS